jgi:hypothetical protein
MANLQLSMACWAIGPRRLLRELAGAVAAGAH